MVRWWGYTFINNKTLSQPLVTKKKKKKIVCFTHFSQKHGTTWELL